jgi:hypothetical protein
MSRPALLLALLASTLCSAQPTSLFKELGKTAPRNFGNLRIGATSGGARPQLCLELAPLDLLSAEACGTGSGFLHHDPAPEIAHFRVNLKLTTWETPVGFLQPRAALGFAELQVGEDGAGFDFAGTGPSGVETAGPEVGLSLRCLTPVVAGFELVSELSFSTAIFAHAPRLLRPQAVLQPTLSVSIGVGF